MGPGGMDISWINNLFAVADLGGGSGSPPPIRPDACLRQDRISLFNWLIFFFNETGVAFCQ